MRRIWQVVEITFKGIGYCFDFLEPYAIALDSAIAWLLTGASGLLGLGLLLAGGTSAAVVGIGWILVGYLLCPALKWGNLEKAAACGVAILLLTIMGRAGS
jgi:hypothetical protein